MICWQMNGYRSIRVTEALNGVDLASGIDYGDGTFEVEERVTLTEADRQMFIEAFGAGLPREHSKVWGPMSHGAALEIFGAACGNAFDWRIIKGNHIYLRGSGNFEELAQALANPDELMG
jgi:hypothetical protein